MHEICLEVNDWKYWEMKIFHGDIFKIKGGIILWVCKTNMSINTSQVSVGALAYHIQHQLGLFKPNTMTSTQTRASTKLSVT